MGHRLGWRPRTCPHKSRLLGDHRLMSALPPNSGDFAVREELAVHRRISGHWGTGRLQSPLPTVLSCRVFDTLATHLFGRIGRWLLSLILPTLWAFSATRARTTRAQVGGCRSFESAFRRSCAPNSAGREETSDYGRTRPPLHTESYGKKISRRLSLRLHFSFQSLRLLPSKAATANLNLKHFLREKRSSTAVTSYSLFCISRFQR